MAPAAYSTSCMSTSGQRPYGFKMLQRVASSQYRLLGRLCPLSLQAAEARLASRTRVGLLVWTATAVALQMQVRLRLRCCRAQRSITQLQMPTAAT
jgi:hypothetical protein